MREGAAIALQQLLPVIPDETIQFLKELATKGNCFQQRASVAAIAEPPLLNDQAIIEAALAIQRCVLGRVHKLSATDRKRVDVRVLRQSSGYTLSVVTAAPPKRDLH